MSTLPASAQCAPGPVSVNGTACTETPGSTITVTTAATPGLRATNPGGQITADGIVVNLGPGTAPRTYIGAQVSTGGVISLNGSTIATAQAATGQRGIVVTGAGSQVAGTGTTITVGLGATTASDDIAVLVQSGGFATLAGSNVVTLGGANGASDHALWATGVGSQIAFTGGTISTLGRGSFGVFADGGAHIALSGGTTVTTTGVQIVAGSIGSHALIASGLGSQVGGNTITVNTSGLFASGARAELGGVVALTNATIISSSTSQADNDPSSAARVLSGGLLQLSGSTITTTGQRGNGFSVQDAGSQAIVSDSTITVSGNRAPAAFIFNGGAATVSGSSLLSINATAVSVQDAGSTINLTNTAIRSTAPVGYGLRVINGGTATITGGSSTTEGRDGPALYAANGSITATNVAITTAGTDNAMGALADIGGVITLNGGSVVTTGDAVRLSSYPHGMAARNPGGTLTATGTSVLTTGNVAMGVVADDGGTVRLSGNVIRTMGPSSLGLYSTVEQAGAQFPALIEGDGVDVETFGLAAHGAMAGQHFLVAPSVVSLDASSVVTHGNNSAGLRAITAGTVNAANSTVLTEGTAANGLHARDNGSSVNLDNTAVLATGTNAHGAVAEAGGLLTGIDATVRATGTDATGLYVAGAPGFESVANFTGSVLTNVSGPTIGVAGNGVISLTGSSVSGSGEWLRVATLNEFAPLGLPDAGPGGVTDPEGLEVPPVFAPPGGLPVVPGLADITATNSTLTGSAFTAAGGVSNLMLDNSRWNMTGSSNITNLVNDPSLIDFAPPTGDPTLLASYMTLTTVNYSGDGIIALNTYLGTDDSPSDRLVIDGGTGTGSSGLIIKNTTGPGALTTGNGILVVDAINGGTTAPGAFSLALPAVAGPYDYTLHRSSLDPTNANAWYLRSTLINPPPCAVPFVLGACPIPPPVPPIPHYRPEVSLAAANPGLAMLYGRSLLDTLHERIGDRGPLPDEIDIGKRHYSTAHLKDWVDEGYVEEEEEQRARGVWGRVIGQIGHHHGDPIGIYGTGPTFDYSLAALQAGIDLYYHESEDDDGDDRDTKDDDGSTDTAGIYGAIGMASAGVEHHLLGIGNFDGGNASLRAYTLGGYWTHYGPDNWYLDAVLQGTIYDFTIDSRRGLRSAGTGGVGIAASLETGYPIGLGEGWILEPQAQAIFQWIDINGFNDGGADIRYSDTQSLTGRIGARLARTWFEEDDVEKELPRTLWGRVNLWHEFLAQPVTEFSSARGFIPFTADLRDTWLELGVGADLQLKKDTALYGALNYQTSLDGQSHGFNAKVGLRLEW